MPNQALTSAIVVISDRVEHNGDYPEGGAKLPPDFAPEPIAVHGGYLERLPLAMVQQGLVDHVEIWHHNLGVGGSYTRDNSRLARRIFPLDDARAPFHSATMLDFIRDHGAPKILCVWGLGVSEALLEACSDSFIIYNSIDAPALRVPPEISRHFDLVITGAQWQSDEVQSRHCDMATVVMPIGPEFASPETFYPTNEPKIYDVIYVAAAQGYKRHDVLFTALTRTPRSLKALCVMGYGENAEVLRAEAASLGIDVDFIGPPGVSHDEVNRLMNQARVGVVCGVDDGAPAILTEYMLAGLPVVANAGLRCGLHYIRPETGIIASEDRFHEALLEALDRPDRFDGRRTVIERWAWPHSAARLAQLIEPTRLSTHLQNPVRQGASFEPAASA